MESTSAHSLHVMEHQAATEAMVLRYDLLDQDHMQRYRYIYTQRCFLRAGYLL